MQQITAAACGMLCGASRRGVTGADHEANTQNRNESDSRALPLEDYQAAIRATTTLPPGVDFGNRTDAQVQALHGMADIAVAGSGLLDAFNRGGRGAALEQVRSLHG